METNNRFTIKRFLLLCRQSLIINKKLIAVSIIGAAGILAIILFFLQSINNFKTWTNLSGMFVFLFCYVSWGGVFTSQSFPAFRSKEKSLVYLLLPASASEKFIFEFLTRIIALILIVPPLFWVVANIEGAIVHYYIPRLVNYEFSFSSGFEEIIKKWKTSGWNIFAIVQFFLFVYFVTFTGACHFSKSPRIKTLFTLSVLAAGFGILTYFMSWVLDLKHYTGMGRGILFIHTKEGSFIFLSIVGIIVNLSLLAISWFRFKEKEV
jgi:hypothetical protein